MLIHAAVDNDLHPPRFGGTQRSFGLCRGLARRHAVRVLCVVPNRAPGPREKIADGVTMVRRKAWYTSAAWRLERARLAPLFLAAYAHRARAAGLLTALPGSPDVMAADLNLAGLLERSDARLRVYTSHNVELDHFRHATSRVAAPGFWAARLGRLEGRAVARAHLTVVCTDEDARRMRELYGAAPEALIVIPNGFDETRVTPPDESARARARAALSIGEREYAALFLGSDTPFNRAGLRELTERVFPAIAGAGFRLFVVGAVTRALGSRREPWLLRHEETDQLEPWLHAADAGLNPVTTGGGSNVKVPTYLGAGLAVVSTEFGLRGYPALRPWVTVAEPGSLAEALRERPLGWRARGCPPPAAVADHAWGRLGERLGDVFEERLAGAGRAAADRRAREAGGGAA